MKRVEFIEGPACGSVIAVRSPAVEYVYQGRHIYTVDDTGGVFRAWYAGGGDVSDEAGLEEIRQTLALIEAGQMEVRL